MKGQGLLTGEGVRFSNKCFYIFPLFYDVRSIDSIDFCIERISFFVTVGLSTPFGPALNPPKTENFRWYLIDLISRVSKFPKTI